MKHLAAIAPPLLMLPLLLPSTSTAQVPSFAPTASVAAVWDLEVAYWKYVQAGDVLSYLTLWHDRFVGWPCLSAHPAAKDSIANWVRTIRDEHIHFTSHLTREGAADFGDIVIVYYRTPMLREYPDGRVAGRDTVWKFTHTWRRDADRWQIIGGMCGLPVVHAF
jgi:ketosteroid isomerase-like protein